MNDWMKFRMILCATLIAWTGLSYSAEVREIRLGALLPLTGSASSSGEAGKAAVETAIEDVNSYFAREKIPYHASITIMDTATEPDQALSAIQSLAADGVRVIVGPYASSCVAAVKGFVDENGLLLLSPASSSTDLSVPDSIFRFVPDDGMQGMALAYYLQKVKTTTVIPVYMNDSFGNSLFESTREQFQQLGGTYLDGVQFDPDTTDFDAIVQTLKPLVEDAVAQNAAARVAVHLIAFNQSIDIFKAASADETLSSVRWVGNDGMAENPALIADPAAAAFAANAKYVCPIFKRDDSRSNAVPSYPLTQQYHKKIEQKLGMRGDDLSTNAYDATFAAALTYYFGADPTDFDSLYAAFQKTTGLYFGYQLYLNFNDAGDRDEGAYGLYQVVQNEDGAFQWKTGGSFRFVDGEPKGAAPLSIGGFDVPEAISDFSISAFLPLTGELSEIGQSALHMLQIAVDDFNYFLRAEGTVGELTLNAVDTQTDADVALAKLQELKNTNSSRIIVGPFSSPSLEAVREYAQNNDFILISPSSTSTMIGGLDDNVYRLILDNQQESEALANLYGELNLSAVVPIWRNDLYGNDLKDAFVSSFQEMGGVVLDGVSYEANQTDFSATLGSLEERVERSVAQYGRNHVGVLLISYEEAETIFAAANGNSVLEKVRWTGCDGNYRLESIVANPLAAEFASRVEFAAPAFAPDFLLNYNYDPAIEIVRADFEGIVDYFLKNYNVAPSVFDYGTYDALWMAALLQLNAGIGETDIPAMRKKLVVLSKVFVGFTGLTNMTDAGDQLYGVFGFSTVEPSTDGYSWEYAASYRFTNRQGNMFLWYDRAALSETGNWELFQ